MVYKSIFLKKLSIENDVYNYISKNKCKTDGGTL